MTMKKHYVSLFLVCLCCFVVTGGQNLKAQSTSTQVFDNGAVTPDGTFVPTFEAPFNGSLHNSWEWCRERSGGWALVSNTLELLCVEGTISKTQTGDIPLLLRSAQFLENMETRVTVRMDFEGGQAGLIWYYDDDNYIKLVKERHMNEMAVIYAREENAKFKVSKPDGRASFHPKEVELRLVYDGNLVTGYYRNPGAAEWIELCAYTMPPAGGKPLRVGLFTLKGIWFPDEKMVNKFRNYQQYTP